MPDLFCGDPMREMTAREWRQLALGLLGFCVLVYGAALVQSVTIGLEQW